jgi:hypothetical protein
MSKVGIISSWLKGVEVECARSTFCAATATPICCRSGIAVTESNFYRRSPAPPLALPAIEELAFPILELR